VTPSVSIKLLKRKEKKKGWRKERAAEGAQEEKKKTGGRNAGGRVSRWLGSGPEGGGRMLLPGGTDGNGGKAERRKAGYPGLKHDAIGSLVKRREIHGSPKTTRETEAAGVLIRVRGCPNRVRKEKTCDGRRTPRHCQGGKTVWGRGGEGGGTRGTRGGFTP